jgi:hypothetical protein
MRVLDPVDAGRPAVVALTSTGLRCVATGLAASIFCSCFGIAPAVSIDVLSSRYDDQRTGANLEETILTTRNVNKEQFELFHSYDTRDDVYAQPLFVSDLAIPTRGRRNVVFVANVNNDVFAFDGDGPAAGEDGILWHRRLAAPEIINDVLGAPGDGNVRKGGNVGIMGTPVIDRERGIMFLVSRQKVTRAGRDPVFSQRLHALDITTGREKTGSPIEIKASLGPFSAQRRPMLDQPPVPVPTVISFDPQIQNQRAGLALSKGQIIIAWGSHQDDKAYYGWVMSYLYDADKNQDNFTQTGVFITTPTGDPSLLKIGGVCVWVNECAQGGIWQTGRAPAIDSQGRVLLFVGNGHNNVFAPLVKQQDYGNSFVVLDPESLALLDFFTPSNYLFLNSYDLDLGGSGPMIIPDSAFESVVGGGKEGKLHVWNLRRPRGGTPNPDVSPLGGYTPTDIGAVQQFFGGKVKDYPPLSDHDFSTFIQSIEKLTILNLIPGRKAELKAPRLIKRAGHIMGGPVYWNRPGGGILYNWSEDSELRAYKVDPSDWTPITTESFAFGGQLRGSDPDFLLGHPGGILTLSANGDEEASGIVWAATYDPAGLEEGALHTPQPGILRAYAAHDIRVRLWTSEENGAKDRLGTFAKFNPPTVANGRVYVATFDNKLQIYGLRDHEYLRPGQVARAIQWWETLGHGLIHAPP